MICWSLPEITTQAYADVNIDLIRALYGDRKGLKLLVVVFFFLTYLPSYGFVSIVSLKCSCTCAQALVSFSISKLELMKMQMVGLLLQQFLVLLVLGGTWGGLHS